MSQQRSSAAKAIVAFLVFLLTLIAVVAMVTLSVTGFTEFSVSTWLVVPLLGTVLVFAVIAWPVRRKRGRARNLTDTPTTTIMNFPDRSIDG